MGNKLQCNDCGGQENFQGIQNLGLSTRFIRTDQPANPKVEYAYYPESTEKFELDKERWLKLQQTKTFIQKPVEVQILDRKSLFQSERGLKVTVESEQLTLQRFVAQNNRMSTVLPEMQIWNIIGNVADSLFELDSLGLEHGNISSETILLSFGGDWGVAIPNSEFVSVRKQAEKMREDFRYLVTPRREGQAPRTIQTDFFSLGVTILDCVSEFPENLKKTYSSDEILAPKIRFLETYYSKELAAIVTAMVGFGRKQLPASRDLKIMLDEMRDQ